MINVCFPDGRCRVWLVYNVGTLDGVWHYEFDWAEDTGIPAPEPPPSENKLQFWPQSTHGPPWLQFEVENSGWKGLLDIGSNYSPLYGAGDDDESLDFLLREGIAPEQPFCVEFDSPRYYRDWESGYIDDMDVDYRIVAKGPQPENLADLLEWAWALKERATNQNT